MAQAHEWVFYELMWRAKSEGEVWPLPWWVQQYFWRWVDFYDSGLFPSKEAAFHQKTLLSAVPTGQWCRPIA